MKRIRRPVVISIIFCLLLGGVAWGQRQGQSEFDWGGLMKGILDAASNSNNGNNNNNNNNNGGGCRRGYGCSGPPSNQNWPNGRPPRPYPQYPSYPRPPRPTYPQYPQYPQAQPQPQYVQPQPQSQPVVVKPTPAPAKNIVKTIKKPKANAQFALKGQHFTAMGAEFDANQANEASKASGKVDAAIEDEVTKLGDPAANQAWRDAVLSGDPEKLQAFKDQHGGMLSAEGQKALDLRIELAGYEQDLANGVLTGQGKDQRLDEINDKLAAMGNGPLKQSIADNVAEMDKFNELGKLSELAQDSDDPWVVMIEGTQNAGYPVSFLAEVSGVPLMTDPLVDSGASSAATTVILNPEETGQTVNYNLGSYPYSIGPGQSQRLEKSYVISFDPGNGGAAKKYTLGTGTYKFVLRDGGWDLQNVKIAVTIDNSHYDGAFNYLVDGQDSVLQTGQAADLESQLPIIIEFDRGDGGKPARKVLTEGTYVVGLDASQQRLDLFDADDPSTATFIASTGSHSHDSSVSTTNKPKSKRADKARQIQEALARLKAKN